MGPAALPMLPKLIGLLADDSPHVTIGNHSRSVAAHVEAALPQLGAAALEPLIAALKDSNPSIRGKAATILAAIHDERAIGPLVAALADAQVSNSACAAPRSSGSRRPRR